MTITRGFIAGIAGVSLLLASCGSDDPATDERTETCLLYTSDAADDAMNV